MAVVHFFQPKKLYILSISLTSILEALSSYWCWHRKLWLWNALSLAREHRGFCWWPSHHNDSHVAAQACGMIMHIQFSLDSHWHRRPNYWWCLKHNVIWRWHFYLYNLSTRTLSAATILLVLSWRQPDRLSDSLPHQRFSNDKYKNYSWELNLENTSDLVSFDRHLQISKRRCQPAPFQSELPYYCSESPLIVPYSSQLLLLFKDLLPTISSKQCQ